MGVSQEKTDEIIRAIQVALERKKAPIRCPVCSNNNFEVQNTYLVHILQDNIKTLKLAGQSIPTVPVVCTNCGLLMQFSLGVLGVLPEGRDEKKS